MKIAEVVKAGSVKIAQHITPRITAVTSVRDRHGKTLGWKAVCHTCHTEHTYTYDDHDRAIDFIVNHSCREIIRKKEQIEKKNAPHHSNLKSGKTGTTGR